MNDEYNNLDVEAPVRRKARKRKPILGLVPRFAFMAAALVGTFVICGALLGKLIEPYAFGATQSQQIGVLKSQLNTTADENTRLQQRRDSLAKPEGIEVAARSQGYLRKGEVRVVLENDPAPIADRPATENVLDRWRSAWLNFAGR